MRLRPRALFRSHSQGKLRCRPGTPVIGIELGPRICGAALERCTTCGGLPKSAISGLTPVNFVRRRPLLPRQIGQMVTKW